MRRLRRLVIAVLLGLMLYQGYVTGVMDEGITQAKYALVRQSLGAMEWDGGYQGFTIVVNTGAENVFGWIWTHSTEQEREIIRRYRNLRDGSSQIPVEMRDSAEKTHPVDWKLRAVMGEVSHE